MILLSTLLLGSLSGEPDSEFTRSWTGGSGAFVEAHSGRIDDDHLDDVVVQRGSHVFFLRTPGKYAESHELSSTASATAILPGDVASPDSVLISDASGLVLKTYASGSFTTSTIRGHANWQNLSRLWVVDVAEESGQGLVVFGLSPNGQTLHRLTTDGVVHVDGASTPLSEPLVDLAVLNYNTDDTTDVAYLLSSMLVVTDWAGQVLGVSASHGSDEKLAVGQTPWGRDVLIWEAHSEFTQTYDLFVGNSDEAGWQITNAASATGLLALPYEHATESDILTVSPGGAAHAVLHRIGGTSAPPDGVITFDTSVTKSFGKDQPVAVDPAEAAASLDLEGDGDLDLVFFHSSATAGPTVRYWINRTLHNEDLVRPRLLDLVRDEESFELHYDAGHSQVGESGTMRLDVHVVLNSGDPIGLPFQTLDVNFEDSMTIDLSHNSAWGDDYVLFVYSYLVQSGGELVWPARLNRVARSADRQLQLEAEYYPPDASQLTNEEPDDYSGHCKGTGQT